MTGKFQSFLQRTHPSAFLLAAHLLFLILYPVVDGLQIKQAVISILGIVVLILRVWVVQKSPAEDWIAWILAIPAFILSIITLFIANTTLLVWTSLLEAALYFYTAGSLVAYMMQDDVITLDEWFAAGATFTLLAWGFGYLYQFSQVFQPGSLVLGSGDFRYFTFVELLSLSFTNLSATGLCDIYPSTAFPRVAVMLEQFVGVGYVTVVISRLVSMAKKIKDRNDDD